MRRGLIPAGLLLGALALASCKSASSRARLDHLEAQAAADDETIDQLAERVAAFERSVDELVALYQQASETLADAEHTLEQASRLDDAGAQAYARATSDYEAAARNWRLVTITLLVAASWDYAGHLCDTRMSTAAYRKSLRKQGVDLKGLDADHGLPKSLGGADHPLNYRMIDAGLNRSLGNDLMRKLMTHPLHVLRGSLATAAMRLRCSPRL